LAAAATGCALAGIGAVIAALISGVSALWVLAGAAVLAASGFLASMAADAVKSRGQAREIFREVVDVMPLAAAGWGFAGS